ncbi:peptidoglycan-binding domain-containing protein [Actinomycetospora soli]|uniref:peptidoglycan-binding domain-containing protein n=1 Tax=Actinomycetospora soli TaxID=2893887 RepID=UPI001E592612|nr:peptidoglycan-binding domain-containing protein [Actinomycetospora soli]MCD2191119.1 peptidoglycan-binding protein [Actinomycetospora soli]
MNLDDSHVRSAPTSKREPRTGREHLFAIRVGGVLAALLLLLFGLGSAPASADESNQSVLGCPRLVEGDSGDCVRTLQWDLDEINSAYQLDQDGLFGPDTRKAVLDFQGQRHLGADGNVGPVTGAAIQRALSDPVEPTPPVPSPCQALTDNLQSLCIMAVWCNSQGLGMEHGDCVPLDPGAAVGAGKSPLECAKELAAGQVNEQVTKDRVLQATASEAAELAAKRLSQVATVGETSKCLFWDLPDD